MSAWNWLSELNSKLQRPHLQRTQSPWSQYDWSRLMLLNHFLEPAWWVQTMQANLDIGSFIGNLYGELRDSTSLSLRFAGKFADLFNELHPAFKGPKGSKQHISAKILKTIDQLLDVASKSAELALLGGAIHHFRELFDCEEQANCVYGDVKCLQILIDDLYVGSIDFYVFSWYLHHLYLVQNPRV